MIARSRADVLLVSMPFGPLLQPSIGLSLLKAGLTERGVTAKVRYFTMPFAKVAGAPAYIWLSSGWPHTSLLAGDWVFSAALFPEHGHHSERYVPEVLLNDASGAPQVSKRSLRRLRRMRCLAAPFITDCLRNVIRERPKVLGFSSVFQQHTASLALARRVKERLPDTVIVFGGGNCEGVMGAELVRRFSFVDAVVSGEGDLVFPELVARVLGGVAFEELPGVYTRETVASLERSGCYPNATMVGDLDTLPYPDYDDYFRQYRAARIETSYSPLLLFESARGCWWGERVHCTFCGVNGTTMAFRSKSACRALEEVTFLSRRYRERTVVAVDKILDLKYLRDFIPQLAARHLNLDLFYEVKANLKKTQIRLLREAGVTLIQPGIESFSSRVLALMRKGVSAIQNIQLLKWCREFGVRVQWNLISGFPNEPAEEYERMAGLVPLLTHFDPPGSYGRIRMDRFSPTRLHAGEFGFSNVTPAPAYSFIYPLPSEALARLACFFRFEYSSAQDPAAYTAALHDQLDVWRQVHRESELFFVDTGTELLVWDQRPPQRGNLTVLAPAERAVYLACDAAQTVGQLRHILGRQRASPVTDVEVTRILQGLVHRRLMIRDGGSYVSLAIQFGTYRPRPSAMRRFAERARRLGYDDDIVRHDATVERVA